jgi:hypothetical protein
MQLSRDLNDLLVIEKAQLLFVVIGKFCKNWEKDSAPNHSWSAPLTSQALTSWFMQKVRWFSTRILIQFYQQLSGYANHNDDAIAIAGQVNIKELRKP